MAHSLNHMGAVTRRRFRLVLQVCCLSVVIGATIGAATASMHGALLFRLALGALSGAITAAILAVLIGERRSLITLLCRPQASPPALFREITHRRRGGSAMSPPPDPFLDESVAGRLGCSQASAKR